MVSHPSAPSGVATLKGLGNRLSVIVLIRLSRFSNPSVGALSTVAQSETLLGMCYSDDARPPLPPVGGGASDQGDVDLTAADGNRLMAYFAHAEEPTGAGMVILPDVRGLHAFYKELAQRFAEAGIDAVAIDYFGRTAGHGPRDESFEWQPYLEKTTHADIKADTAAAVEWLRSPEGGAVRAVFTVGF